MVVAGLLLLFITSFKYTLCHSPIISLARLLFAGLFIGDSDVKAIKQIVRLKADRQIFFMFNFSVKEPFLKIA
jgi:hypothetical protein